jgi:hypothetical protein
VARDSSSSDVVEVSESEKTGGGDPSEVAEVSESEKIDFDAVVGVTRPENNFRLRARDMVGREPGPRHTPRKPSNKWVRGKKRKGNNVVVREGPLDQTVNISIQLDVLCSVFDWNS